MLAANDAQTSRFPNRLFVRTPAGFVEAIDAIARQHHQCVSDFVRQLLVREMRRAGVRLRPDGSVEHLCRWSGEGERSAEATKQEESRRP